MSASDNKAIVEHAFAELEANNSKPFLELMSDAIEWTIIGSSSWSRTFRGRQAVRDELLVPLRSRLLAPVHVTARRIIAEGDFVVVEARGESTTKSGAPYNNSYCWIFRFAGGRAVELTEYLDTLLAEQALGPLEPAARAV